MSIGDRNSRADDRQIAAVILKLCIQRGAGKTICPSEAARALAGEDGDWRAQMEHVRRVGAVLMQKGRIEVTQRGNPVEAATTKGPIRFGLSQKQN